MNPTFEVQCPRVWQGVILSKRLRATLLDGWRVATERLGKQLRVEEFVDPAINELQRHQVIVLIDDYVKAVGDGPFMVELWHAAIYGGGPMWVLGWDVDWRKIWNVIVPVARNGQLAWRNVKPIPRDGCRVLQSLLHPFPFGDDD